MEGRRVDVRPGSRTVASMLLPECAQRLFAHCYAYMRIFYCPHMRNSPKMTESGHFGDNAHIVADYLSPNAHIGGRLLVSVFL